jgi:hypothetical protein
MSLTNDFGMRKVLSAGFSKGGNGNRELELELSDGHEKVAELLIMLREVKVEKPWDNLEKIICFGKIPLGPGTYEFPAGVKIENGKILELNRMTHVVGEQTLPKFVIPMPFVRKTREGYDISRQPKDYRLPNWIR